MVRRRNKAKCCRGWPGRPVIRVFKRLGFASLKNTMWSKVQKQGFIGSPNFNNLVLAYLAEHVLGLPDHIGPKMSKPLDGILVVALEQAVAAPTKSRLAMLVRE